MTDILTRLRAALQGKSAGCRADEFVIRGVWEFTMRSRPSPSERTFAESGCLVATSGLGASFRCDSEMVPIPPDLIGRDARQAVSGDRAMQVAILDACYAVLPQHPVEEHVLSGDTVTKSVQRARIVRNEIELIAARLGIPQPSVLMIGVVDTIAGLLHEGGMTTVLSDLDSRIVGSVVGGTKVHDGGLNRSLIRSCDMVLATGMTMSTSTIDEIVTTARQYAKPLVMFAQTGSNFAEDYIALGIDSVVAEPYPWYCLPGQSIIRVFRRRLGCGEE